ncbi:MAG: hypothetical protein II655_07355, partial [Thermoguttaceae bacterium]|nr:hypothetical protein [Thermoguttaceae bacterium]
MSIKRNLFGSFDNFRRGFQGNGAQSGKGGARKSGGKKRSAPKPFSPRLENLEERQLLSVVPPFADSLAGQNPAPAVSEYSYEQPALAVPDLASALSDPAPLQTQATRDAGDLAVVTACGLNPDNTNHAKWNSDGRLTYLNCDGSTIAELDLSGCTALGDVYVRNCANLTSLDLSGLQSLVYVYVNGNASLTDLNLDNIKTSRNVNVYNNNALTELDITGANIGTSGYEFYCYNNASLTSFTATNCQTPYSDTYFELHDNPVLTDIDLTGSSIAFEIYNCASMTSLDLSSFTSLKSVNVRNCANLTSLDLSGLQSLVYVYINGNANLTDLNLDNIKTSRSVNVYNNNALTELDITGANIGTSGYD